MNILLMWIPLYLLNEIILCNLIFLCILLYKYVYRNRGCYNIHPSSLDFIWKYSLTWLLILIGSSHHTPSTINHFRLLLLLVWLTMAWKFCVFTFPSLSHLILDFWHKMDFWIFEFLQNSLIMSFLLHVFSKFHFYI